MQSNTISNSKHPDLGDSRRIRIFISSTFKDMEEERNILMSHAWPELRRLCRERHVEMVEVDLRWGISEEQSSRKETLKLCLDEIHACRPFFISLLGERYGWVPGSDSFTKDLEEEQPWLKKLRDRSVTELEILHGVLNDPEMASRSFFYFRDPAYAWSKGADFLSSTATDAEKQKDLKERIRSVATARDIPLRDNYPHPEALVSLVIEDLKKAIDHQFPIDAIPDSLERERQGHEAFAEMRRRTYIGREEYYETLDRHVLAGGGPLVVLGESGSGKSSLLANWVDAWRKRHPEDLIIQHYIGGTTDSADHWRVMTRVINEIARWTNDPEDPQLDHEKLRRDFPLWLAKGRLKAERDGVRLIIILDALNQLEDNDGAYLLHWLPEHPFQGSLRFVCSTLPGETLDAITKRNWDTRHIALLETPERRRMIVDYLNRFGKKLDDKRLGRIASADTSANPLFLRILLDELRVTGTYEGLDKRVDDYLSANDIPALLEKVFERYQRDYEKERPGLVKDTLGFIWAARRGLAETELLELLRPDNLPRLPAAVWTPLRAALEESLIDLGGILNFSHDFFREAVRTAFVPDQDAEDEFRLQLADYFERTEITTGGCEELLWLLWQTESFTRLRVNLLDIDRFLEIEKRDMEELRRYWVGLGEERIMGELYLDAFYEWVASNGRGMNHIARAANLLGIFLFEATLYDSAEQLFRQALAIDEKVSGSNHPATAPILNNLAELLRAKGDYDGAEPLYRRSLAIFEKVPGPENSDTALSFNNLALLLKAKGDYDGAESLCRRSLAIFEKVLGPENPATATSLNSLASLLEAKGDYKGAEPLYLSALAICEKVLKSEHPTTAQSLNNLALFLRAKGDYNRAEPLFLRALAIVEKIFGPEHPATATILNNLALLLKDKGDYDGAEPLFRRALAIREKALKAEHPDTALSLNNLALLLKDKGDYDGAESLCRRSLAIFEKVLDPENPNTALSLNNLALLLRAKGDYDGAEPFLRRALAISEKVPGPEYPVTATILNNLAEILLSKGDYDGAEPLFRKALAIFEKVFGPEHPDTALSLNNLATLLEARGAINELRSPEHK